MSRYRVHVKHWRDAVKTAPQEEPLCGQANTYSAIVLSPGDPCPDAVSCVRCRNRQEATV